VGLAPGLDVAARRHPPHGLAAGRVEDSPTVADLFDCTDPEQRAAGLDAAAAAIARGELVLLPTDTVYGVAADAFTPAAVTGLLAAKNRGRAMPVPVLIGEASTLAGLVVNLPPVAHELAREFWPGGLTLVLEHAPSLAWDLGDAEGTVAVRLPDDDLARELLRRTGPLAARRRRRRRRPMPSSGRTRPSSWTAVPAPARERARSSTAPAPRPACCASGRSVSIACARSSRTSPTDADLPPRPLTEEQARRSLVPSGTTLLGLVEHATFVEKV
jgi:L-threonylcarbamoyladenylate synthase